MEIPLKLFKEPGTAVLEELAVVDRMAQEENISLTGQEEDDIKIFPVNFFRVFLTRT